MLSKRQDKAKSNISSVLFMTADGKPMSFFLRPGPVKRKLQPLITSGGGMLCSVQQQGAILLINPEERGSICETTAHWYVSTHYIYDCIERKERLNIEDYRLNPEVVPRHSPRLNSNKDGSSGMLGGRVAYTPEDDAAILSYVSKHKTDTGGNRLWQTMEKQRVTSHSWQSMKYHYRVQLAKKQSKNTGTQDTDVQKPPSEDAASPQPHSPTTKPLQTNPADTDLTQIDELIPAEITQPENVDAEGSNSLQPGSPCLDPQKDSHPIPAESKEPETAESQTTMSPQKESAPEDSLQSMPNTLTPKITKWPNQRASPELEQPQRRLTRRQLELDMSSSPEPYGKKLRSSSTSADNPSLSPQPTEKMKSAIMPVQKHTTGPPPSKRARGKSVAESQQDESEDAAISESPQTEQSMETREEEEPKSLPQKKKEKRKLGILELATKEFEDESESAEDEAPDLQNPTETAAVEPTSTEPLLPSLDIAGGPAAAQPNPEPGPSLQEKAQQIQGVSSHHVSEPAAPGALHATSRTHMFIFDSESQEDESQSLVGDSTSALSKPQPPVNKDAALSLTQVQLEEDKQRIRQLMNQTNQDLASVTKALLKTSGDLSAALDLLLDPSSFPGPFWNKNDDSLLLSADPVLLLELQEKYSEEEVAKRIVFLEAER